MKIGLGALRHPPDVFWAMSLREFMAALDGYAEARGVKKGQRPEKPLTRSEFEALKAQYPD